MKALKFNHASAEQIILGDKTTTFRIFDDKDINVNDRVELIDKVDAGDASSWKIMGTAKVDEVTQKRLRDITEAELEGDKKYRTKDELLKKFQTYYGKNVTQDTPVKMIRFSFTPVPGNMETNVAPSTTIYKELELYADGGSRGNPGPSACGFVLIDNAGDIVIKKGIYLGVTTNNQAEYHSLKQGLLEAKRLSAQKVRVYMDSQLVIKQMQGIYKVKNRDLWPLYTSIIDIITTFKNVSFKYIPRELNKIADSVVNEVLNEALRK